MAEIIPFKGILYNPESVDATLTMAPPYDVIAHDKKNELYERSPNNIIRIDFGKDRDGDNDDENRYTRASDFLSQWMEQEVLIQDENPYYYCYEVAYEVDGQTRKTRGFLGAVKIEELGKGRVHPHEMTYSKPKSDRLNILRHCNGNTSPIFSLYSSEEKRTSNLLAGIVTEPPFIEARDDDGFMHRLWRISDNDAISTIRDEMADLDVFIADGHHRYETAQAFKKEMEEKGLNKTGKEPFNYTLMFLSNMEDEGLTLLPTHRIVEVDSDIRIRDSIKDYFDIQKLDSEQMTEEQLYKTMADEMSSKKHSFGMFLTNADAYYVLSYNGKELDIDLPDKLKKLDVSILHNFIFEKLLKISHYEYEMDPATAVKRAGQGSFEAVFFLNATKIHDVRDAALAGHRMPPKSTYFFPKLLTGMVMFSFDK